MAFPYLLAAGLIMKGFGQYQANMAEADAEEANASYYREQAKFAKEAGERQRKIFDRESHVLYGEQLSAFAKSGVDTTYSSYFMAKEMLYRQEESYAIKKEADMNVRLAMLRAGAAESHADSLRNPVTNLMQFGGTALTAYAGYKSGGSVV